MKNTFLETHKKINASGLVQYIDRDRGQIDIYQERPAVKFPCALIKVNQPRRNNLSSSTQQITETIQIRIAFEQIIDQHNLQSAQRLDKALDYYDAIQEVIKLFQGLKLGDTDRLICTSVVDEDRADFDVVRLTFTATRTEHLF